MPTEVVEPVDSTGAGDAFCGAFAAEHLRSDDPYAAARAGAEAARIAVSAPGIGGLLGRADTRGGAMTRITVINPNTSAELTATITAAAQAVAGAGVDDHRCQPRGRRAQRRKPRRGDDRRRRCGRAGRQNQHDTDAFVIACFGDTGVAAAREVATCPVVGMTEAALQTACLVAHRFVVITLPARTIAHSDRVVRALGLEHRCSVVAVDVPVAELVDGSTHLLDAFAAEARTAIDADQAEAVVLGCAGLADLVGPLTDALGVPVIDGVAAGVGIAAGLVAMGLNTSRANTFAAVPGLPDYRLEQP